MACSTAFSAAAAELRGRVLLAQVQAAALDEDGRASRNSVESSTGTELSLASAPEGPAAAPIASSVPEASPAAISPSTEASKAPGMFSILMSKLAGDSPTESAEGSAVGATDAVQLEPGTSAADVPAEQISEAAPEQQTVEASIPATEGAAIAAVCCLSSVTPSTRRAHSKKISSSNRSSVDLNLVRDLS